MKNLVYCSYCDVTISDKSEILLNHMRWHHNKQEARIKELEKALKVKI